MNSSEYELAVVCESSDGIANYDVSRSDWYLGRLYVLPVSDPQLVSKGIDKKWFLTHQAGDFIVSGYINSSGDWSLSRPTSVEPSFDYVLQSEVFDQIFSPDYVREVRAICESHSFSSKTNEIVEVVVNNDPSNDSDESVVKLPKRVRAIDEAEFGSNLQNLHLLRELALQEQMVDEEVLEQAEIDEITPTINADLDDEKRLITSASVDDEFTRARIERDLVNLIIEQHKKHQLREFLVEPLGVVTVDLEQDSFVLRSLTDKRIMLAATLRGEILEQLRPSDARVFEQRDEIEPELLQLSKEKEQLATEVAADASVQTVQKESEQQEPAQIEIRDEQKAKKSRGIELS
ncbi:hypothetical protein [Chroococcidiopsis sp.]|uniref:hypothetical protein n=1 Tax=Chroococcidiopsis sp. TaxID=3088168 RepID=UPI003F362646